MKKTILTMLLTLAMMLALSCEKHSTTHYELIYNLNDSTLVKEQKMGDTLVFNYFKIKEGGRPISPRYLHKIVEID